MTGAFLEPGEPFPLGAHVDGDGVRFALFSEHAQAVELCLFDSSGRHEQRRLRLPGRSGDVWHARLPGAGPGLVYAYRVHGPWAPAEGHRFDPQRLLLDPYAREIVDPADGSAGLRARVVDERVDQAPCEPRPRHPMAQTLLYEAHVKGLTKLHPGVPPALRGSYAGLATDAIVGHLQRLGVTTLSLLPVQQHLDEPRLAARGLANYWGYNPVGLFAVEPRYASSGDARREFRAMVRRLHGEGIEVVLDMVFNHTAESDLEGPTLAWRGIDNRSYYRSLPGEPGCYDNLSGCGNALDLRHPRVLQLVLDCLRWWAGVMNVDGFRFDLAPVLARGDAGFDTRAAFFHAVAQDPVLAGLKMIAEPWDLGPGGYRLGQFPRGWAEWNDRFRDGARRFWLRGACTRGEFAQRLCASADTFRHGGREPWASVNFVSAHDGFTLRDLVSFEQRHNESNGEGNRDGHAANHGWNCGAEGPSGDAGVLARRARLQRSLLATLLLAQGTPMLAAGAELGHSQQGNNNAYCQDNATSWIAWPEADEALAAFAARAAALRRELPAAHAQWYDDGTPALHWRRPDGAPMTPTDWNDAQERALAALLAGGWLLAVNAGIDDVSFVLPPGEWTLRLTSTGGDAGWRGSATCSVAAHGLALFELTAAP